MTRWGSARWTSSCGATGSDRTVASRALIIANSRYDDDHFATLPAAAADAVELGKVLGDPAIGGFTVETLADVEQRAALRTLESFFARAKSDDLLLLHLSLHGWKDLRNRLYFVMRDTERDYPGSTAISADTIGTWMGESRSRRIVVLLDCCYSGAFTLNALRRDAGTPGRPRSTSPSPSPATAGSSSRRPRPCSTRTRANRTSATAAHRPSRPSSPRRWCVACETARLTLTATGSCPSKNSTTTSTNRYASASSARPRRSAWTVPRARSTWPAAPFTPMSTASPRCDPPCATPSPGSASAPCTWWNSCSAVSASRPGTRPGQRCSA
ncbi:caspase family protein [Streptomyces sp. NPDC019531]|uniref:caspase family protein n=1 Tax=Streptomyces sp. NPDC019531 TaxID=3365062 RepID=UPI0038511C20